MGQSFQKLKHNEAEWMHRIEISTPLSGETGGLD